MTLLQDMQACGQPPAEIMKDVQVIFPRIFLPHCSFCSLFSAPLLAARFRIHFVDLWTFSCGDIVCVQGGVEMDEHGNPRMPEQCVVS